MGCVATVFGGCEVVDAVAAAVEDLEQVVVTV